MTIGLVSLKTDKILQTQRNGINVNQWGFPHDFAFINHIINSDQSFGNGGQFKTTAKTWPQVIDANGYPNDAFASGIIWGDSVNLPGPNKFGGVYIVAWDGDGSISIDNSNYTWSLETGTQYTSTYTGTGGNFTNVSGKSAYIGMRLTANINNGNDADATPTWSFTATGGPDGFVRNLRWYRLEDEPDLLAGKVLRTGFKQSLANLNPAFIRFMNWAGGNTSNEIRFENRAVPAKTGVSQNFVASPIYSTDATGVNQFVIAAATPTTGNPKTTPASMQHGEIVTFRTGAASTCARCGTPAGATGGLNIGGVNILGIEKNAVVAGLHPVVQTNGPHGYNTDDIIVCVNVVGMTQINYVPCVVTVIDATHFAIDVDTSGYGTFVTAAACHVTQFITAKVGSGNDRVAYPIVGTIGSLLCSVGGNQFLASNYSTLIFNKDLIAHYTPAGVAVPGAWVFVNTTSYGGFGGFFTDVPLEYCVALINELNAMLPAGAAPIHMYWNVPAMALTSFDQDYSAGSNYAVKAMDVILNGANGFSGLKNYPGLKSITNVFVEHYNETWNFTTTLPGMLAAIGRSKYGLSLGDLDTFAMIKQVQVFKDLQAAYPSDPRIKYMLGFSAFGGSGLGSQNWYRLFGNTSFNAAYNATVPAYGPPINYADAAVYAPYIDISGTAYWAGTTGTNTLTNDCAMYGGLDNSANGGGNYVGAANTTQAITNFVTQADTGSLDGNPLRNYYGGLKGMADMMPAGKFLCQYEGGANWSVLANGVVGYTALAAATLNSAQWGTAQINFWKLCAKYSDKLTMPAVYLSISISGSADQRWAYASQNSFAKVVGVWTEGAALANNGLWSQASARNQGLTI